MAHGGTQYKDVFDNHAPLFSLLLAPVVGVIGDRPDIVVLSRLFMIPFMLSTLALVWLLTARLDSPRTGPWAAAVALLIPDFMLGSVEYRPDQLWTTVWLLTVAILCLGRATRTRMFFAGLLLGTSFCVSMKTLPLTLALVFGGMAALAFARGTLRSAREIAALAAVGLVGALVVPSAIVAYFAWKNALSGLAYGTIVHNIVPGLGMWSHGPARALLLPISVPVLLLFGRRIYMGAPSAGLGIRRSTLFLATGFYYVGIQAVWPLVTRQDFLPWIPMLAIVGTPYLLGLRDWARSGRSFAPLRLVCRYAPALTLVLLTVKTQMIERVWKDNDVQMEEGFLREVLRTTGPGDLVMDQKGETIFRTRPWYYALEEVTCARIQGGLLRDSIAERLVETRTPVAVSDLRTFPPGGRAFLTANYLPAGSLRYAGMELDPPDQHGWRRFVIRVPQRYALLAERGPVAGLLDGSPYVGARELAAGPHAFLGSPSDSVAMCAFWSDAIGRGVSPYPNVHD